MAINVEAGVTKRMKLNSQCINQIRISGPAACGGCVKNKLSQKVVAFLERTIAADPGADWSPPCSRRSASPYTDGASSGRWREQKKNDASHDRSRSP
jgi:hypothetical protein